LPGDGCDQHCVASQAVAQLEIVAHYDRLKSVFGDAKMTAALLDRLTHYCDIVETGNDSWRFKSRDDDQTTRARTVSATPASQLRRCERYRPNSPLKGVPFGCR
jgi:IstB-like ATP binding protein